jgi:serine/threonine-protein kinase
MRAGLTTGANFGVGSDGTLAYVIGLAGGNRTLIWVDREGREEAVAIEPSSYIYPRISPDGRRVALDDRNSNDDDWIWDLAAETRTRLTVGGIGGVYPVWTADGSRLAHTDTGAAIVVVAANDTGAALTLVAAGTITGGSPSSYFFTPDDSMLVFRDQDNPDSGDDILMVATDGASMPVPLLAAAYHERNAELSPDGRFMAYQSDESGRFEVYVRPFPNVDADRVQISNAGGAYPLWSRDGRELFYLEGNTPQDRRLMAVAVEPTDGRFAFRERRGVLEWPYVQAEGRGYDVALDGQRFLAIKEGTGDAANPIEIVIVQNWTEELQRLVPTN